MLTFIDKNEVYSERKFDEVSKYHHIFNLNTCLCLEQLTIKGCISYRYNTINTIKPFSYILNYF